MLSDQEEGDMSVKLYDYKVLYHKRNGKGEYKGGHCTVQSLRH